MYDRFNRNINYLRISVTDRCNLRCTYCMPECGVDLISHKDVLSFEEILEVVKVSVGLGVDKVRITGGEPLVRKGIVDLVEMIAGVEGIKDLAMTTNGTLLDKFAASLKKVGLHRVNISLDTLSAEKFKATTRGGDIQDVFNGIQAAKEAGLVPIKINVVKMDTSKNGELDKLKAFCEKEDLKIQFIRQTLNSLIQQLGVSGCNSIP